MRHPEIDKTKILLTNSSLMKVKDSAIDLHQAIIRLETQFLVFLRMGVLERFYCILQF